MKRASFRRRLFGAMLLASLIPLLICTVLMVQITRLQMDRRTQEEAERQSEILLESLDAVSDALVSSGERLLDSDSVIHDLASGQGSRLKMNTMLFDATDSFRSYAVFDLYDAGGICRYSTRGSVSGDLPTDWGVLSGAAATPYEPVFYASEDPSDTGAALLLGAV